MQAAVRKDTAQAIERETQRDVQDLDVPDEVAWVPVALTSLFGWEVVDLEGATCMDIPYGVEGSAL